MKKIALLLVAIIFVIFGCNNEESKTEALKNHSQRIANKYPYINLKSENMNGITLKDSLMRKQMMYSAYKRAVEYMTYDTTTCKIVYSIKNGKEIGISPLLQELIKFSIKKSNDNINLLCKKSPVWKKEFKEFFSKEKFNSHSCTNQSIPPLEPLYKEYLNK